MNTPQITSIKLTQKMNEQLEKASRLLHRGKSRIVKEALSLYLLKLNKQLLSHEAKRQSKLASKTRLPEDVLWENNTDETDWR